MKEANLRTVSRRMVVIVHPYIPPVNIIIPIPVKIMGRRPILRMRKGDDWQLDTPKRLSKKRGGETADKWWASRWQ